jgi:glycosyltransferase involved in cell wall biosynthesis
VLEVNAPIIDHPGSPKRVLDRLMLVEPMRRWRDYLCRHTDLFVTPQRSILPAFVEADDVVEIEWGADTDRFHPTASGTAPYQRTADEVVAVFAGAFRAWHGARLLVEAIAALDAPVRARLHVVFIGDGPELPRVRAAAARAGLTRVTFTGAVPYDRMPAALAAADIGVAPFDVAAHPPLQLAFYWSPLKVFEYMASGRPVVAPRLPRLAALVADRAEGWLYDPHDPNGLRDAIAALTADASLRLRLGEAARARAVHDYSWRAHCIRLAEAFDRRRAARERA